MQRCLQLWYISMKDTHEETANVILQYAVSTSTEEYENVDLTWRMISEHWIHEGITACW